MTCARRGIQRALVPVRTGRLPNNSMEPTRPARVSHFMRYKPWLAGRLISRPLGGRRPLQRGQLARSSKRQYSPYGYVFNL
jgi:hypothetical protein